MAKAPRITFKRGPRIAGLARVSSGGPHTDIKLGGKVCGCIRPPHWSQKGADHGWSVGLYLKDESSAGFTMRTFTKRFTSEPEARAWLLERFESLNARYGIHTLED